MNKPTLDEFIKNPAEAIKKGYEPDFMSIGALVASVNGNIIKRFQYIFYENIIDPYYSGNLLEVLLSIIKNLLLFILALFFLLTGIPLFPIYWVLVWSIFKCYKIKRKKTK